MSDSREPANAYSTTLGQIVTRVSALLADNDPQSPNVHWSLKELVDYVNEGCREVISRQPEAFASTIPLSLQTGGLQKVPERYESLFSIEEAYDTRGRAFNVTEVDYKYSRLLTKPTIRVYYGTDYMPRTFTRHPLDQRVFYVDPPVPPGAKPKLMATVVVRPEPFSPDDVALPIGIRPEYEAQLVSWVLYRAYSKDTDSQHFASQANAAITAFNNGLDLKLQSRRGMHHASSGLTEETRPRRHGVDL